MVFVPLIKYLILGLHILPMNDEALLVACKKIIILEKTYLRHFC